MGPAMPLRQEVLRCQAWNDKVLVRSSCRMRHAVRLHARTSHGLNLRDSTPRAIAEAINAGLRLEVTGKQ